MEVKESEKVGLKLNIQKTKIMASGPITSWQIDRETVTDFIFLGTKITAGGDCSHEIKRFLLVGRQVMSNLVQFSSVAQSCPTLRPHHSQHARPPCPSPTPRVHLDSHHWVSDAIHLFHPLLSPTPAAPNPSQHQGLFKWVNSSHEVAKVLEFQL